MQEELQWAKSSIFVFINGFLSILSLHSQVSPLQLPVGIILEPRYVRGTIH